MKKILVPLDGSELADGILKHVEQVLGREPGEVTLLWVDAKPQRSASGRLSVSERLRKVEDPAVVRAHLQEVKARLEEVGAKVTLVERQGDPAAEILAAIQERAPDLVAMCSRARSAFLRWVQGSVTDDVVRGSPAPVLLITPRGREVDASQRFRRILVPLDGTEDAAKVLPLVEDLARKHEAEVVLARVEWDSTMRPLLAAMLTPDKIAESLRPWVDRLRTAGLAARAQAVVGDSATEILQLAEREDVDLIAMTTHGRTGLLRLLDASVTERVLHSCTRPLLVLRA